METIPISRAYSEIMSYYAAQHYRFLEELPETKDLFVAGLPYRICVSEDELENDLEKIRRYLTRHFRYLMRNVLCCDLKHFKSQRSYRVPSPDYTIILRILQCSVSQNERDRCIGRWLNGKLSMNSYHEVIELCDRLFEIIADANANDEVRERWIATLKIALDYNYAYTMTEMEYTVRQLFTDSLPFRLESTSLPSENLHAVDQEAIRDRLLTEIDADAKSAQDNLFPVMHEYMSRLDLDTIQSTALFPPVDLLKLKAVCRCLYHNRYLLDLLPHREDIETYMQYFKTIDKEYREEIEHHRNVDKTRKQQKKAK